MTTRSFRPASAWGRRPRLPKAFLGLLLAAAILGWPHAFGQEQATPPAEEGGEAPPAAQAEPEPAPPSDRQVEAVVAQVRAGSGSSLQDWPAAADRVIGVLQRHAGQKKDVMLLFDVSGSMGMLHEKDPWGLSFAGEGYWSARRIVTEGLEPGDLLLVAEFDNTYSLLRQVVIGEGSFDTRDLGVPPSQDIGTNVFFCHDAAIKDLLNLRRPESAFACLVIFTDGYLDQAGEDRPEDRRRFEYYTRGPGLAEYVRRALTFGQSYGVGVRTEGGAIVPNSFPEREPPTPVNGALAGRACDADREPLDGCRVLVSGPGGSASETQTDAQGYFSATGVQAGRYDLTITRSGYRKTRQEGVQVAAGLVGDCGTITLEKTNCGPIGIALLVLLAIAIVVALVAKGLLNRDRDRLPTDELRAGKAARGYRCRDSSGAVEEIVGSKSMYNVTVDVESGVIRAGGSGDYVVTFGGSPVPPGGETRLRPGDLVIRTRDGLELGRWHLER